MDWTDWISRCDLISKLFVFSWNKLWYKEILCLLCEMYEICLFLLFEPFYEVQSSMWFSSSSSLELWNRNVIEKGEKFSWTYQSPLSANLHFMEYNTSLGGGIKIQQVQQFAPALVVLSWWPSSSITPLILTALTMVVDLEASRPNQMTLVFINSYVFPRDVFVGENRQDCGWKESFPPQ